MWIFRSKRTETEIADTPCNDVDLRKFTADAALRQEGVATHFCVSRIPVRETIGRLEYEARLVVQAN
jgi:DNA-binding GntR family transcriptional regulator